MRPATVDKELDFDDKRRNIAITQFTALGNGVVIVVDDVTVSNLIFTGQTQDRETTGVVLSVGSEVKRDLKMYDRVIFAMHAGKPMRFGNAVVKRVTEDQIHVLLHRPDEDEIDNIKKLAEEEKKKMKEQAMAKEYVVDNRAYAPLIATL